jgi:hypothetical protein
VRSQLTPLETNPLITPSPRPSGSYAVLTKDRAKALVRAMPDCQSAVLTCLVWQASLHEKMRQGPFAGRPVASLSGSQLSVMTGRPLRTVRHALRRLSECGLVVKATLPGRKAIYELPWLSAAGGEQDDLNRNLECPAKTA